MKKESYFKSVLKELKVINWPKGKDVIKYSIATVGLSLFFAGFFILINLLMAFIRGI